MTLLSSCNSPPLTWKCSTFTQKNPNSKVPMGKKISLVIMKSPIIALFLNYRCKPLTHSPLLFRVCKSQVKIRFHTELWPVSSYYCINRWSLSCTNISCGSCWPTEHSTTKPSSKDGRNTLPTSLQQQHGTAHSAGSDPLRRQIPQLLPLLQIYPVLDWVLLLLARNTVWTVETTRLQLQRSKIAITLPSGAPDLAAHCTG